MVLPRVTKKNSHLERQTLFQPIKSLGVRPRPTVMWVLQFLSVFQSSDLIGWVRVNLVFLGQLCIMTYSGKLSREKTFTNFVAL